VVTPFGNYFRWYPATSIRAQFLLKSCPIMKYPVLSEMDILVGEMYQIVNIAVPMAIVASQVRIVGFGG